MNANNGWPGKPGVPSNSEKDGWHWLEDTVDGVGTGHIEVVYYAAWSVPTWYRAGNRSPMKNPENWIYRGFVLTPDEATALQARADRNAAGFARVDAEAERAKFLHKQEIAALQKRVAELVEALGTLEKAASYTAKLGAVTGAHWLGLGTALIKARAALEGKKDE